MKILVTRPLRRWRGNRPPTGGARASGAAGAAADDALSRWRAAGAGRRAGGAGDQRQWRARPGAAHAAARSCRVFAVGPQTAAGGAEPGFHRVRSADGDAAALARAARGWAEPGAGRAAACRRAKSNDGALAKHCCAGLSRCGGKFFMRVTPRRNCRRDAVRCAAPGRAGCRAVLFAPQRRGFPRLRGARRRCRSERLIAVCISAATAAALAPLAFAEVRIAAAPNQDALLLDLLDRT